MAHFAQLDNNNTVTQVIVISNEDLLDNNGIEQEHLGINVCKTIFGSDTTWIQTSYNNKFRRQYAAIGYTYDPTLDVFIPPRPYPSWNLDENKIWQAPTPKPDGDHVWDENSLTWTAIQNGS